jgi:glycosyltransferase involved in cell wall biosynthesis
MPKALLSVTNDLVTDQRVHRTALSLMKKGYSVLLIGRKRKGSMPLPSREYPMHRMNLFFEKGALFYAEYNVRLFIFLLFSHADMLFANDLDTLPANYLASLLKGSKLVYDSHEYFTEVPELEGRGFAKVTWEFIEKLIFPRLRHVCTVNESIAKIYEEKYGVKVRVVRNVPVLSEPPPLKIRQELSLPQDVPLIVLQGSGININRGAEEAVAAMQFVSRAVLLIIGDGDVLPELKKIRDSAKLHDKVLFIPRLPFSELNQYTRQAEIGLSLDKDISLNYRFSLPNKIFDYIPAGVPVLASSLPEVKKIIGQYRVGVVTESHDPRQIAEKICYMLADEGRRREWKENTLKAKKELCWQNEEKVLFSVFETG